MLNLIQAKVVTAPVEKTILPKAIATPSLAASIIYRKYAECIPYYRQECAFNYRGIYISRQNMDNWQDKIYQAILPLKVVYQNKIRKGKVLHCDETVLQVLNLNEKEIKAELNEDKEGKDYSNRQKCYVWVMMGGTKEHPVLDYNFRWARSKNNPFTVGRGNWKFNISKAGAESSCFMFSLVNTAKANGLNPEEYLRNVFEQAPYCKGKGDWEKLLPWNIEMKPFENRGEWL